MSTVMNGGVNMLCKTVTYNFFTGEGLLFEPIKEIAKPKIYLDTYPSIR